MDPKTGELAKIDPVIPALSSGPHTPTSDDVKKDPRFLARQEMARRVQESRSIEEKAFTPDIMDENGNITPATEAKPEEQKAGEVEQPEPEKIPTEGQAEEPQEPEQQIQQEEERELIIDGKTVRVPISKIIDAGVRTFQKETTADQRLAAAAELERQLQARVQQFQPSKDAEQRSEPQSVDQPSVNDAELAHAIQFGTEEQAREAISKLRNAGRGMSDTQLQKFVNDNVVAALPLHIAFHTANERIRSSHPEIFGDPDYAEYFMLQETKARQSGDGRSYDELYKDIAGKMVTKFNLRKPEVREPQGQPIPAMQERIARKAAAPRPAQAASGAGEKKSQEQQRPLTVAEQVEKMRQRRGLQPLPH